MRTGFETDAFQRGYFVVDRFEDVLDLLRENDFPALYAELAQRKDPDCEAPADRLAA